jgi:lipoprotein-anchoring transpeptidase ErfK/SrfK
MKILSLLILILLLAVFPGQAQAQTADDQCPETYRIVRGDWLSIIAFRCGLTVQDLLQANPEIRDPARIYVGQVIRIPTGAAEAAAPQTPAAARPEVKASRPNIDRTGFDEEMAALLADQTALPPELLVYTIRRGDRLSSLARQFNTSVAAILDFNPEIQNPHRIFTGQRLTVPPSGHEPSQEALARVGAAPLPPQSAAVPPAGLKPGERWIDVSLSTQSVHAYEGETLVRSFIASTGRPATPTVTGQYRIYVKLEKTDMRGPGYHYRDVPFTMYFYRGYGLHGTFWHNNFGTPRSAGCVNLSTSDAKWLFNFSEVGTLVSVRP